MIFYVVERDPHRAAFFDQAGVDRIFVDLELLGKEARQGHLDTVISRHKVSDIMPIKKVLQNAELMVRIDPINPNSRSQINQVIDSGADMIMLPFFKKPEEVEQFLKFVDGRVKTNLLLETAPAFVRLEDIVSLKGIDEIHIGLNDLSLSLGLDFMFEIISQGFLSHVIPKIKGKNIPFGIGGIAPLNFGKVSGALILAEYLNLGSSATILSRTFSKLLDEFGEDKFVSELLGLRNYEEEVKLKDAKFFQNNFQKIKNSIKAN